MLCAVFLQNLERTCSADSTAFGVRQSFAAQQENKRRSIEHAAPPPHGVVKIFWKLSDPEYDIFVLSH